MIAAIDQSGRPRLSRIPPSPPRPEFLDLLTLISRESPVMDTSSLPVADELISITIVVNPDDASELGVAVIGMVLLSPGPMPVGAFASISVSYTHLTLPTKA